jgi:hypothetical protein
MLRRLWKVRSYGELSRKARAGLSVLTMRPDQKVFEESLPAKVRKIVPGGAYDAHS